MRGWTIPRLSWSVHLVTITADFLLPGSASLCSKDLPLRCLLSATSARAWVSGTPVSQKSTSRMRHAQLMGRSNLAAQQKKLAPLVEGRGAQGGMTCQWEGTFPALPWVIASSLPLCPTTVVPPTASICERAAGDLPSPRCGWLVLSTVWHLCSMRPARAPRGHGRSSPRQSL